jgi:hypothetical protein
LENIAASGLSVSGWARCAPFGVPVVPEVRMMNRLDSSGGLRSPSPADSISCSVVGSSVGPSVVQET